MKKICAMLLSMIMVMSMSACGSEPAATNNKSTEPSVTDSSVSASAEPAGSADASVSEPAKAYVQPEMKGEININVYESSEWLETAAKMFTEKYPEIKVNIHSYFNGTDVMINTGDGVTSTGVRPTGQTREDYIAQLNTQLLSGEADDIIITSIGLPMGRYIKMGAFEDLSPYLESAEGFNDANYYMNIFDACRTEQGALYQFPIYAFAIPTVHFNAELMENTGIGPAPGAVSITWRDALDVGKQMYDASTLPGTYITMGNVKTVIGDIYTKAVVSSINYDTGKVEIDRDKMIKLLSVLEEIKDYKVVPQDFDFYAQKAYIPYGIEYMSDVEQAAFMLETKDTVLQQKYDDGKVYLSPYYALDFGITGQSKNKELSWEFLKFLVSEEVQTLPSCSYAGVNKNGLKARVEGYMSSAGTYSKEEVQKVTETVDGWIKQINAYRSEDTDLIQISEGTLNDFAEGSVTAEKTIDNLISRLEQYMSE